MRLLKLAHQPDCAWRERGPDFEDHGFGVATAQDVEEKMRNGKVEWTFRQAAADCIDLVKFHLRAFAGCQSRSRQFDHPRAAFDNRDASAVIRLQQTCEKSPIAFAQNQYTASLGGVGQKIEPGTFQPAPKRPILQPAIAFGDAIDIHRGIRNKSGLSNTPSTRTRRASKGRPRPTQNSTAQAPALTA